VPSLKVKLLVLAGNIEMKIFCCYGDFIISNSTFVYQANSDDESQKIINAEYGNTEYVVPDENATESEQ